MLLEEWKEQKEQVKNVLNQPCADIVMSFVGGDIKTDRGTFLNFARMAPPPIRTDAVRARTNKYGRVDVYDCWTTLQEEEYDSNEDSYHNNVECTLPTNELHRLFDTSYGGIEGVGFRAWTDDFVYFPTVYDGSEEVASVSRNPVYDYEQFLPTCGWELLKYFYVLACMCFDKKNSL